jgi:hypothetical protein
MQVRWKMTLKIARNCCQSLVQSVECQPFHQIHDADLPRGGAGFKPAQIRDRKASDFPRISNILAVHGAKTCISNKNNKRTNPDDYAN